MGEDVRQVTVANLVAEGVLERPMDGNHGELHPKGSDFVSNGVPFITAADLKEGWLDLRGCSRITEEQARGLRKGFARCGDVLLTHKATIGRTAVVGDLPAGLNAVVLSPQVTYYRVLRPEVLDPTFLRLYFDTPEFQSLLQSWSGGGVDPLVFGYYKTAGSTCSFGWDRDAADNR